MKKKFFIIFMLYISLSLLSCTTKREWHFEKPYTDVKKYL